MILTVREADPKQEDPQLGGQHSLWKPKSGGGGPLGIEVWWTCLVCSLLGPLECVFVWSTGIDFSEVCQYNFEGICQKAVVVLS